MGSGISALEQGKACDAIGGDDALMELFSKLPGLEASGELDLKEMKSFIIGRAEELEPSLRDGKAMAYLRQWDTDGDYLVTASEWLCLWRRVIFEGLSKDTSPAEMFRFFRAVEKLRATSGDERNDCRERALFARLDLDDSNTLDLDELTAFCKGHPELVGSEAAGAQQFLDLWDRHKTGCVTVEDWVASWVSDREEQGAACTRELLSLMERAAVKAEEQRERELFRAVSLNETRW